MFLKRLTLALALLIASISTSLHAQTIHANNPSSIVTALQDLGYRALLETDNRGDPIITSKSQGANFAIYFYECEDNRDCQALLFAASFTLDEDGPNLSEMNDWNADKILGKAFIDNEGDYAIDMFVSTYGGLNLETFEDNIDWWEVVLGDYIDFIGW